MATKKTEQAEKKTNKGHENLKPQNTRTKEEQRRIASQGGKASVAARRRKKALKECFDALLDKNYKGKDGKVITGSETLALAVFQKAQRGDLKAFEIVRDTAGQKPIEKVMLAEVDQDTIDQVEAMVLGGNDANSEAGN